ncbi:MULTISPECIES: DoxX family protein [Streptomyces]|uniref:DoxX family protein n=1 Tax=Streptomyces TaxID=1883 RepID=UPI0013191999|nr:MULTISPECIES: DoxX family protein [Streptomyces]QGZ50172.1 DoxX family membrane protein [Streptomyces sp. QHH-9511]
MSVDTRTPRPGIDDQPALSMVKVASDPAQVIVNHASFRVRLAPAQQPKFSAAPRGSALAGAAAGATAGRRRPVVWTGRSAPGDPGATGLLQAVRESSVSTLEPPAHLSPLDAGATQAIPRIGDTRATPVVPAGVPLLPPMRRAEGAYDHQPHEEPYDARYAGPYDESYGDGNGDGEDESARTHRHGADPVRHAYYPGRRMNLGVVLLPLRVFLGFISIYAGMGKLCDPVYFDGGERGSMVKWLNSLHPWALAEPLRDFALQHPVGAGLTVAFLQVVVGVLTVFGLWQRVAAVIGALLSAAMILTVSWKSVPVYDAPDIIFLAAWSPLIIAGAPVYSLDGRLAGEAWRTLGPRSELWELRRRVLRRGALVTSVVVGLTLLVGSMLGGAVRSTEMVTVPGPNDDPINHLPGRTLPKEPGSQPPSRSASTPPKPSATTGASGEPEDDSPASPRESARETGRTEESRPTATQGTGTRRTPAESRPAPPPSTGSGPTSTGGTTGGSGGSGGSGSTTGGSSDGGSTGGANRNPIGGLLG